MIVINQLLTLLVCVGSGDVEDAGAPTEFEVWRAQQTANCGDPPTQESQASRDQQIASACQHSGYGIPTAILTQLTQQCDAARKGTIVPQGWDPCQDLQRYEAPVNACKAAKAREFDQRHATAKNEWSTCRREAAAATEAVFQRQLSEAQARERAKAELAAQQLAIAGEKTPKGHKRTIADSAVSLWKCAFREDRAAALKEIQREHRYGKIGGALDLSKLHELQEKLSCLDEFLRQIDGEVAKHSFELASCRNPKMKPALACLHEKWSLHLTNWAEYISQECRDEATLWMLGVYDVSCD